LSHFTSPILWGIFWDRILQTICPGWLWTSILLISASWVARITGVSHWLFYSQKVETTHVQWVEMIKEMWFLCPME
jgi:hypothetical protein